MCASKKNCIEMLGIRSTLNDVIWSRQYLNILNQDNNKEDHVESTLKVGCIYVVIFHHRFDV